MDLESKTFLLPKYQKASFVNMKEQDENITFICERNAFIRG